MLFSQLSPVQETPIHPSGPQATHHAAIVYPAPVLGKPPQTKQAESCPPGLFVLGEGATETLQNPQEKQVPWSKTVGKKPQKGWGADILDTVAREASQRR